MTKVTEARNWKRFQIQSLGPFLDFLEFTQGPRDAGKGGGCWESVN